MTTSSGLADYETQLVPTNKVELRALTGVRFFAAFLVVLDHFSGTLEKIVPDTGHWPNFLLFRIFGGGAEAVSFFFVLSGFILTFNYQTREGAMIGSRRNFYVARLARIYPAYIFGFLLGAVPYFWSGPDPLRSAWVTAALTLLLLQGWDRNALPWNGPAWSLSVEAFFYLLFPFLLRPLARLKTRGLLIVVGLCYIVSFSGYYLNSRNIVGYGFALQGPIFRVPEFLIGMLAGRMFIEGAGRNLVSRIPSVAIFALTALAFIGVGVFSYPLRHGALLSPLFALLIYRLAIGSGKMAALLSAAPLLLLGEASYALYITHSPILTFLEHYLPSLPVAALFALYAAGTVSLSVFVFLVIETPARRAIRRRFSPAP